MYAFQKVYQKIETFIFSTQIARITNELNTNHFNEVKANFSEKINIWSGGTKIGQSLSQFNKNLGKDTSTIKQWSLFSLMVGKQEILKY
jgi:uncharacterized protein with von Willebrand factor type A (vWA) domain